MCIPTMSVKSMRFIADHNWQDLTDKQKARIKKHERKQVGAHYKYGYTNHSLFNTCIGLVYCDGYGQYCDILHSL